MSESEIVQMLISGQKDLKWYGKHLDSIKEQYNELFVAVLNESIIDSDKNAEKLIERLRKNNIDRQSLVKFVTKVKSIL